MDASDVDRLAVEKPFGVGERRARQIMTSLAGLGFGKAGAVSVRALIAGAEDSAGNSSDRRGVSWFFKGFCPERFDGLH